MVSIVIFKINIIIVIASFNIFYSSFLFPFLGYGSHIAFIMAEGDDSRSVGSGLVANSC